MTIVCGIDTTDSGRQAVHLAIAVAKQQKARLHLVHAVEAHDVDESLIEPSMRPAMEALRARVETQRAAEQAKLDALALEAATSVQTKVTAHVGRAWEVLLAIANDDDATHIVVGPHASTGGTLSKIGERLLGSTARRVVRHAGRNVWVACGDVDAATNAMNAGELRAVVGVDFAPGGRAAVNEASRANAKVVAVHALRDPFTAGDAPIDWSELRAEWRQRLDADLKRSVPSAVATRVEMGDPVRALIDAAEAEKAHAIFVGAHAGGTWTRLLLGDTAERALRMSPVPVLVVQPHTS